MTSCLVSPLDNRVKRIYNIDVIFYIITTAKAENSIDDALDLSFRGANESYECGSDLSSHVILLFYIYLNFTFGPY